MVHPISFQKGICTNFTRTMISFMDDLYIVCSIVWKRFFYWNLFVWFECDLFVVLIFMLWWQIYDILFSQMIPIPKESQLQLKDNSKSVRIPFLESSACFKFYISVFRKIIFGVNNERIYINYLNTIPSQSPKNGVRMVVFLLNRGRTYQQRNLCISYLIEISTENY